MNDIPDWVPRAIYTTAKIIGVVWTIVVALFVGVFGVFVPFHFAELVLKAHGVELSPGFFTDRNGPLFEDHILTFYIVGVIAACFTARYVGNRFARCWFQERTLLQLLFTSHRQYCEEMRDRCSVLYQIEKLKKSCGSDWRGVIK